MIKSGRARSKWAAMLPQGSVLRTPSFHSVHNLYYIISYS